MPIIFLPNLTVIFRLICFAAHRREQRAVRDSRARNTRSASELDAELDEPPPLDAEPLLQHPPAKKKRGGGRPRLAEGQSKRERVQAQWRKNTQAYRDRQFDRYFDSQQGHVPTDGRAVDWRTRTPRDIPAKTNQHDKQSLPPLRFNDSEDKRIQRKTAAARAFVANNLAKGRSGEGQKIIDCLGRQRISTSPDDSQTAVTEAKTGNDLFAENAKALLQMSKCRRTNDARSVTAANATAACPGTAVFRGKRKISRATGLSEKTLDKYNKQRRRLMEYNAEWGVLLAKRMCRKLLKCSDADIEIAQKYWEEYCPPMNKYGSRGTARNRVDKGQYVFHKKHLLRGSQAEVYTNFKQDHPDVAARLKFAKFKQCKPFFIIKQTQRDVCLTYQDIHIRHLIRDLVQQLGKKSTTVRSLWRSEQCTCDPNAKLCARNLPNTLQDLINVLLCPRPEGERFHSISCLEGSCAACGIKELKSQNCSILWSDQPAKWHEFFRFEDNATGKTVYRECRMPCQHDKKQRKATRRVMMEHLVEYLQSWNWFDFIGEHQMKQILRRMDAPPPRAIGLSMDFAAIFSWEAAEDAQSAHYMRQILRILVCVVRRPWDESDGELIDLSDNGDGSASGTTVTEVHYFVALGSDVQHQKWAYVQFAMRQLIMHYNGTLSEPVETCLAHMDGCSGQFKSRHTALGFTRLQDLTRADYVAECKNLAGCLQLEAEPAAQAAALQEAAAQAQAASSGRAEALAAAQAHEAAVAATQAQESAEVAARAHFEADFQAHRTKYEGCLFDVAWAGTGPPSPEPS